MSRAIERCARKLALCIAMIASDEENRREDPANRSPWSRLIREAHEDARYWAIELYLAGGQ
jgi:hypothetical protein